MKRRFWVSIILSFSLAGSFLLALSVGPVQLSAADRATAIGAHPARHVPAATAPTFTRMDESTADQWGVIAVATIEGQGRVAERVLEMLGALAGITDGFAVDQLTHSLQTATLAERAGADDEVVVASLCHDIGKFVSVPNHPRIAAEILRPYVREEVRWMIEVHQDFQGRHYYHHFGGDPDAREKHRDSLSPEEFGLAEQFADDWDQKAFDPDYDTLPLEHFEERVRKVFGAAQIVPTATITTATSSGIAAAYGRRGNDCGGAAQDVGYAYLDFFWRCE